MISRDELLELLKPENIKKLTKKEARELLIRANQFSNLQRANLLKSEKSGNILSPRILAKQSKKENFRDYKFALPKKDTRNAYISKLSRVRDFLSAESFTLSGVKTQIKKTADILDVSVKNLLNIGQENYDEFWREVRKLQQNDEFMVWARNSSYSSTQLIRDIYSIKTGKGDTLRDKLYEESSKRYKEAHPNKKEIDLNDSVQLIELLTDKVKNLNKRNENARSSFNKSLKEELYGATELGRKD